MPAEALRALRSGTSSRPLSAIQRKASRAVSGESLVSSMALARVAAPPFCPRSGANSGAMSAVDWALGKGRALRAGEELLEPAAVIRVRLAPGGREERVHDDLGIWRLSDRKVGVFVCAVFDEDR